MGISFYVICCFSLAAFNIFSLYLVFDFLTQAQQDIAHTVGLGISSLTQGQTCPNFAEEGDIISIIQSEKKSASISQGCLLDKYP